MPVSGADYISKHAEIKRPKERKGHLATKIKEEGMGKTKHSRKIDVVQRRL